MSSEVEVSCPDCGLTRTTERPVGLIWCTDCGVLFNEVVGNR
jgi:ribosomal protein L37AE/L43A